MRTIAGLDELESLVGQHLGTSEWLTITQERIDAFADATGDHQWIHVDPQRAADGPFGTTIAHGYLTLSLLPMFFGQTYRVQGLRMGVNYGSERVRFLSPVPVNSRVRASIDVSAFARLPGNGARVTLTVTVELDGSPKPACVAESISLVYA